MEFNTQADLQDYLKKEFPEFAKADVDCQELATKLWSGGRGITSLGVLANATDAALVKTGVPDLWVGNLKKKAAGEGAAAAGGQGQAAGAAGTSDLEHQPASKADIKRLETQLALTAASTRIVGSRTTTLSLGKAVQDSQPFSTPMPRLLDTDHQMDKEGVDDLTLDVVEWLATKRITSLKQLAAFELKRRQALAGRVTRKRSRASFVPASEALEQKAWPHKIKLTGEGVVQLAIGGLLVAIDTVVADKKAAGVPSSRQLHVSIEDHSLSGIAGQQGKLDYACFDKGSGVQGYSTLALIIELKDSITRKLREVLGQSYERIQDTYPQQPWRRKLYVIAADLQKLDIIRFTKPNSQRAFPVNPLEYTAEHSGPLSLALQADSLGLQAFVQLVTSAPSALGFVQAADPGITDPQLRDYQLIHVSYRHDELVEETTAMTGVSLRETMVYSAYAATKRVAVKTTRNIAQHKLELNNLCQARAILGERCPEVLRSGVTDNTKDNTKDAYLVLEHTGVQVTFLMTPYELMLVMQQTAELVGLLHANKKYHGDLSPGNISVREVQESPDSPIQLQACLVDFATLYSVGSQALPAGHITGTQLFMAVDTQLGKGHTLDTELQSLMHIIFYLAAKGKVPWRVAPAHWEFKVAFYSHPFRYQEMLRECEEEDREDDRKICMEAMHKLFFPDFKGLRTGVTVEEFKAACKGCLDAIDKLSDELSEGDEARLQQLNQVLASMEEDNVDYA